MNPGDRRRGQTASTDGTDRHRAGRFSVGPTCLPDEDGGCSLCGDEGLVAEIVESAGEDGQGRVRLDDGPDAGDERRVALDLVPRAEAGDRVVVHMGFAIGLVRSGEEG